ncbi:MAG TPA: two-component regulator propeller domain-containing protein [Planctomycetota bacterium]|nr:two-component regulator propeller domain-containing protein [Planctomycetota bacterium]
MRSAHPAFSALPIGLLAGLVVAAAPFRAQEAGGEPPAHSDGDAKLRRTLGSDAGSVGCELVDEAGNLWFRTAGNGVFRFDGRSFTNFTTKDGLCHDGVSTILQDKAGNIVFGTAKGICSYDGKTFTKRPELGERNITSMLEARDGSLWFGTFDQGVFRYDGESLTNFLNDRPFNLRDRYQLILDIVQDRSGNLWFSSWNGGGVWRYDGKEFRNYLPSAAYYEVKDGFSEDGRNGAQAPTTAPYESRTATIGDDMIFCIAEDSAGHLWFGTRAHGACRYDPEQDEFTHFREKEGFVTNAVYCILEDSERNIWLTTESFGVWRYDGKTFENFTTEHGLVNDSVLSALEDASGGLWFGTRGVGLSRYDGKSFVTYSD